MEKIIQILGSFDLSTIQWVLCFACAMLIGMSKTGVAGVGLAVVPILAAIFGSRPSTGFLLPILIFADVFAVTYYNRHAKWKHISRLMPWALLGIIIGTITGNYISSKSFDILLAILIIAGAALMVWRDMQGNKVKVPGKLWFAILMGLAGGFTTMIGNAAGPVMTLYLLSTRLPKNSFIGTAAWFFMIINLSKIPFHVFVWKTIDFNSVVFDIVMVPAIAVGAFSGIFIVKYIPERPYRVLVIATTIIAAIVLFVK